MAAEQKEDTLAAQLQETEPKRAKRLALSDNISEGGKKNDVRRMHHVNAFRRITRILDNERNVLVMQAYVNEFGDEFKSHKSRHNVAALHKFLTPSPLGLNNFYKLYNLAYPSAPETEDLIESFKELCSLKKKKED